MDNNSNTGEIIPIKPPESKEKKQLRQTELWKKIGLWALLVFIGMLIGAAVIFFALYTPKNNEYKQLARDYDQTSMDLEVNKAASEEKGIALGQCNTDLDASKAELQNADVLNNAYAVLFGAKEAKDALNKLDTNSAKTALNTAQKYMNALVPLVDDSDAMAGISGPLASAIEKLPAYPSQAMTQLDVLINNLNYFIRGILENN